VDKEEEIVKEPARMVMVLEGSSGILIMLGNTMQRKSGKTIPMVMDIKNCLRLY
jgi:hypothetical protein